MRTPRVLVLAAAGALLLSMATACSDSADDADLVIYSGRNETLVKPILERFKKSSGLTLSVRYGDTAQMAAQLVEEGDKTPATVFLAQDAGALGAVAKKGLLSAIPDATLAKVDPRYRSASKQWVGLTARARVLTYNPLRIKKANLPPSVFDLTKPAFKNHVGIAPTNASFQAFITAMRLQHGDAKAKAFLTGLKANGARVYPNNVAIVNDVYDGKVATGLVNHYYVFEKTEESGASVELQPARLHYFAAGDSGNLVNVSGIGILKKAAGNADAVKLIDFLLGQEAQTYFAEETFEYPLLGGVPIDRSMVPLDKLQGPKVDLEDLDGIDATVAMLKETGLA